MIYPEDINQTHDAKHLQKDGGIDDVYVAEDVVPIYGGKKSDAPPSKLKLGYDILMLALILLDLALIFFNQVVMSVFFERIANWLGLVNWLIHYKLHVHELIVTIGGFFTLFLFVELVVRWGLAIYKKTYYRWFFFPFVHWYEALGCFPLLRPLRLLRAIVIVRRLHELKVHVVPERWIKTAKFYGHILLEELSDRVILTAVGNFRAQLAQSTTHQGLIQATINKNREALAQTLLSTLRRELVPKLQAGLLSASNERLSQAVGQAAANALSDAPELRRYLRLIPIAGGMIESQLAGVGRHIGERVTMAVNQHLFSDAVLDALMQQIAVGVSDIDTTDPKLQLLVAEIVNDALDAFEAQVKVQQWKHTQHISL